MTRQRALREIKEYETEFDGSLRGIAAVREDRAWTYGDVADLDKMIDQINNELDHVRETRNDRAEHLAHIDAILEHVR